MSQAYSSSSKEEEHGVKPEAGARGGICFLPALVRFARMGRQPSLRFDFRSHFGLHDCRLSRKLATAEGRCNRQGDLRHHCDCAIGGAGTRPLAAICDVSTNCWWKELTEGMRIDTCR